MGVHKAKQHPYDRNHTDAVFFAGYGRLFIFGAVKGTAHEPHHREEHQVSDDQLITQSDPPALAQEKPPRRRKN
ncbi:MAG: hypothetical protein PUJ93_04660, partial [Oscillospiraceae bacterium]|nr:hypothetical protein [Oscillospiraceae bacterium]MDY5735793.1 hypothetical protein [Oscillospiraceae bacterium]